MDIKIVRYPSLNYTPAVVLATKGWLEQNLQGIGDASASIHWEHKAIVAFDAHIPVGVISWTHIASLGALYAEQIYRREGVFREMWADLLLQALEMGVSKVRLGTHPDNVVAQKAYEAVGGKVFGVFYEFGVPQS